MVDVTGGVFGGCCQVTLVLVKSSILTCVKFTEQDGGPKMENAVDSYWNTLLYYTYEFSEITTHLLIY